jgi:hypothetical protein
MKLGTILKTWRIAGSTLLAELQGGLAVNGVTAGILTTLTYGAAIAIDASLGDHFVVSVTDAVAFAFGAPTNPPPTGKEQVIYITVRNTSGGAHGAGTWNAIFKTAGNVTATATGFSRTYAFRWNGTNWVEIFRTAADVAN